MSDPFSTFGMFAGMPAPLPTDIKVEKVLMLNETALQRFQVISFFLLALFLSALVLKVAWNSLQRDFPSLPRLTYLKSLLGIVLMGALLMVVLTMISGARELMTPGAWKKDGFTYKLADEPKPAEANSETARRQHLEKLRTALWHYAATHEGRFPAEADQTAITGELWVVPGNSGLRYVYVPGRKAGHLPEILAYEPELDPEQRLVLRTNGDIVMQSTVQIQAVLAGGNTP